MTSNSEGLAYEEANPWEVVNITQPAWDCGRYPSRHLAIRAAATWPRLVGVADMIKTVYVSDVPLANPKPEIID